MFQHIAQTPAFWGFLGAFIYAGPLWAASIFGASRGALKCTLDAVVSLTVGAIAAACFTAWILGLFHRPPEEYGAVASMIGLLANKTAPRLIERFSKLAAIMFTGELTKVSKGDDP